MSNAHPEGGRVPQWTLGERLRKAREDGNLSTDELAADIGRSERTVRNYERDATRAPLLVIRQYALRTGVSLAWLSGDGGEGMRDISRVTLRYPAIIGVAA